MRTMRLKVALASLALLALGFTLPREARAGVVVRDSIRSTVLGVTKLYSVYLPDAFLRDTTARFPVLYLLHGLTDDDQAWTQRGQMERICDELMLSGEARPMIVVMPGAGGADTKKVWNGYFNMTPAWRFEDYFFEEFIPKVEAKYRHDGKHRAVAGLSMGGGGSVGYALDHPELFSSCYAMSAWLSANEKLESRNRPGQPKFAALVKAVNAHDPLARLENATPSELAAWKGVKWFVDCGDDDFLLEQNLLFYGVLRIRKLDAQLRVRDGGHSWDYWQEALRLCLPFTSRSFD